MNRSSGNTPATSGIKKWYLAVILSTLSLPAAAFNIYLDDFNATHGTQGTRLDTCGICHYNFNGGGTRTPYGEDYRNNNFDAASVATLDSDGDTFTNEQEAAAGTLTHPGLSCDTLANVLNAPADIADYVDPNNPGCVGPGQPPTANANGPYVAVNGQPLTFSSAGSTDADGIIVSYLWNFGGGFGTSADPNPVFTYNLGFNARITVTLTVTDNDGNSDTATTFVDLLRDPNSPPSADAGLPVTGTVNTPVQFDGSASSDPEGGALSFTWDFGDGVLGNGATPSHSYTRCGDYSVALTVTDPVGLTGTATTTAAIASSGVDAPQADAGGDATNSYQGTVGSNIQFDGSGSSDLDCTIVSFDWDFGDGTTGAGQNPVHSYAAVGDYIVTLTVTDNDGLVGTASATVSVVDTGPLDGAALYDAQCGACHGFGGSSTKAGATVERLNNGIATVPAMNFLATALSAQEIQAISDYLVSLAPPPGPTDGATLYDLNCAACHGAGGNSTKIGATVARIDNGIAAVTEMNFLSTVLSAADIQAVSDYLVSLAPPPGPTDGATLYDLNCAACHGAGGNSTKIGATVARIDNGIAAVAEMNFLSTVLSAADIQAVSDYLVSLAPPPGSSDGATLYDLNCAACHGPGDSSAKAGATVARIDNGIAAVAEMNFLATVLSAADIQAIADFLASAAPPTTPAGLYTSFCSACHGADGSGGSTGENVQGDSSGSIASAIQGEPEMQFLNFLTDQEIQLIAEFLASPTVPPPGGGGGGDGATLYDLNCAACHGPGDSSAKAGATVARINAGISSVSGMAFLANTLSAADIQAIADFLATAVPPPSGGDGATLYDINCAACHGTGDSSAKAGATVERINTGIAAVAEMNFLSTVLSAADIQAIADFLATAAPPTTPEGLYTTFCGACHGADGRGGSSGENVRGESTRGISSAIREVREMRFLDFLTSEQISAISSYLGSFRDRTRRRRSGDD